MPQAASATSRKHISAISHDLQRSAVQKCDTSLGIQGAGAVCVHLDPAARNRPHSQQPFLPLGIMPDPCAGFYGCPLNFSICLKSLSRRLDPSQTPNLDLNASEVSLPEKARSYSGSVLPGRRMLNVQR